MNNLVAYVTTPFYIPDWGYFALNGLPEEAGEQDHSPTDDPLGGAWDYKGSLADFNIHQCMLQFNWHAALLAYTHIIYRKINSRAHI